MKAHSPLNFSPTETSPETSTPFFSEQELAYLTPAGLGQMALGTEWTLPRHLAYLICRLMDVAAGRTKRLIVTMPPGHGKSTVISKIFPSWMLGRFPKTRLLLVSHEADYAAGLGAAARDIFQGYGPEVFGLRVAGDVQARKWWGVEDLAGNRPGGWEWTAGIGGAITGKRVNGLIIDDPVKNEEAVWTQNSRDKMWAWFQTAAHTRLEPGGWIVIVMTRWHLDDIAGRCLEMKKQGLEDWEVVDFPAIAREDEPDVLERKPGEALWPERYPVEELMRAKVLAETYSGQGWESLYQGRPVPRKGSLFQRDSFRYFWIDSGDYVLRASDGSLTNYAIDDCWKFSTSDLASSTKETADHFVCCVWAVTPKKDLLLLDVYRKRIEGPDQLSYLVNLSHRFDLRTNVIEAVQYQQTLVQYALREGLKAEACNVHRDKFARAQGPAARLQGGTIYFLQHAEWLPTFEAELLSFRQNCKHDDQVDNLSMAVEKLAGNVSFTGGGGIVTFSRRQSRMEEAWVDPRGN